MNPSTTTPRRTAVSPTTLMSLSTDAVSLGYGASLVVDQVSVALPPGQVTVIVGPNGCGKSTLLRGLARLIDPVAGRVHLDGQDLARIPAKELATKLGLLPQGPSAPDGITVSDLVGRGRHPHQRWFRQWSPEDEVAVDQALADTSMTELAERPVDELSGGQRQRVWIALALAQDPEIMLLDEPTTYLDLAHQIDVLNLLEGLNRRLGRTIVLVLHDLNMAARYAQHLVAMRGGQVVAQGPPEEVVTAEIVADVFGVAATVIKDPVAGTPLVLPHRTTPPPADST